MFPTHIELLPNSGTDLRYCSSWSRLTLDITSVSDLLERLTMLQSRKIVAEKDIP